MQDVAPQLLEAVSKAFQQNLNKNKKIKDLQKKLLSAKDLKGNEAELYAVEVGEALAKAFHDEINADTLPDGRMYYNIASRVIPPPLRRCYEDVADYAQAMHKGMNERAGLGLKAQRAKYNEDRVKGLIEYACGTDDYASRQKNFEGSLVNYSQSVATDTMKENAEFQYQAGLSPVIRRRGASDCCSWCKALIGDYPYETVKATGSDVYRRHRDCRCQVYYDPGDGKVQNVHTKRWEGAVKESDLGKSETYRQYMRSARPGVGKLEKEPGYQDDKKHAEDIETTEWLIRKIGGDYTLLKERRGNREETPDCVRNGVYLEYKKPTTINAVERRIKKGTSQIAAMGNPDRGVLVLDITKRKENQDAMLKAIRKEGVLRSKQKILDIIVRENDDIVDIIRIKK